MAVSASQVEVHVTYVDKDGPLIKIFAQNDKSNACLVERLLYQLREHLESINELKPRTTSEIKVGQLCCAKFEDGVYYRARIESVQFIHKCVLTVTFIDHGNKAEVNVFDIRMVSKLLQWLKDQRVERVLELPGLAQEYYVVGIEPVEKEWDDHTIEFLRKKLCNTDLTFAVFEFEEKKLIKILSPENDPVTILSGMCKGHPVPFSIQQNHFKKLNTKKTLGLKLSLPEQFNVPPPSVVMQQPPPARLPNVSKPPPIRMSSEMKSVQHQTMASRMMTPTTTRSVIPGISVRRPMDTSIPPSTHHQSLQFSTEMLTPGVSHAIFVSHVEDGPYSFAVQLQSEVQEILTQMMANLNNIVPQPITAPLNPGSICLARYSEDQNLYRAIVMNVKDDVVKLYFADFGSSEVLPYSEIFHIPPQFVTPKVMSYRFTLANIKDMVYSDQEKKLFKNLVTNCRALLMKVTPPEANPLKQYCELFLNCKNIKIILTEVTLSQPPLRYQPLTNPFEGSQERVFVPFVLNPGRFFVQLDRNSFSLNQIMSCVATHCQTAEHIPLMHLKPGEPCCALYEDQQWYRAEILKVNPDNTVLINFVDYGNQEELSVENLRETTQELVQSVRAQALVCCLTGYELRHIVEEDVSNRLEELILEKKLMMHVVGSTESAVLIVQLFDQSGQDIGTLLEARPSQSPIYNNYQATTAPTFHAPPPKQNVPKPAPPPANDGWKESSKAAPAGNTWEDKKFSESRGPSDENKSWRSQPGSNSAPRSSTEGGRGDGGFQSERRNRDGEEKSWRGETINRDDNRGRFNRDEDGGGRFNKDDSRKFGDRGGRFNDEDKGGRFSKDNEPRSGRFNEDRGSKFNNTDDKPWKKRDDDSGGWKSRENSGSGFRDAGGDRRSRFDGDSGFKKGGFNRDSGENSSFRKPWERDGSDSSRRPALKVTKPDTVGGMPHSTVKVGTTADTQVVFTTSPVEFYVQLNSSFDELNELMEKIATACESGEAPDLAEVAEKCGCLAKYSEDDKWYRAYTEAKSFDTAKVLFVDYGNREDVPFDQIKTLSEDMSTLPVQAIKCRLFGVPETAEVGAFSDLVAEKNLKTQFVAKHFLTNSFQVVMVDEESGTNINSAMGAAEDDIQSFSSTFGATTLRASQHVAGSSETVQVTWYLSPSQFYLQSMATNPEFRAMMQSMQSVVRTGSVKQNNTLNVDDFVIARFKADKVLYRALVKETGFAPTVQFVDYGNSMQVDSGNVWSMEPEYATLPLQAFSCCLAGVQPNGDAWPKANTTQLDEHFEADTLECTVIKELESEQQYLVKLVNNGQDIAQKIIDAGFAVAGSDRVGVTSELDTSLLVGQLLPTVVLLVDEDGSFFIQPPAEHAELQSLEATVGEGIKCSLSSVREDASEEERAQIRNLSSDTNVIVMVDAVQPDGLQVTMYDGEGQLLPLQASETTSVTKICPLPVLNTHQRVFIAHADEDGIYLHKVAFADNIAELLEKLYEFYNETEQLEHEWTTDEICCAKSVKDEQWYRARVLETGPEVKVQYVDYGNSETVPVTNLRKLDPSFYTPQVFALKTSLHVSWSVPVENLLELSGETEYNAVVLRNDQGWVVELVDDSGQSLTEKLVELGFAVALENSPFKRVVEGGRFVEGSDISVSVSFIDSPLQLWVFVGDDIELVEALQDRLQEAAPKLPFVSQPNSIFAAKFSDGLWYRALKLNDTTVRFIDYGNSDEVDMSDIKSLSADFLEPAEGYAVKVELPVADYKEGAKERLEELLVSSEIDSGEDIVAHVLSVKESFIFADISKGGKSVVDILAEENLGSRLLHVYSGFVSHTNSLTDFFIQEVGCEEALETMTNRMSTAESFEMIPETNEGDIVAALFTDDGSWYRAKVTQKTNDTVHVLFIDYGNSAETADLRTLPDDLKAQPALARHCALLLPAGVVEWSTAAYEKFVEISEGGCAQFEVRVLNKNDPATVSLSFNDKSVTEELKLLCEVTDEESTPDESSELSGYDKNVYISHVNSPTSFYIQFEGAEVELDAIKDEFSNAECLEALEQITEDAKEKIIGSLFTEDEQWYRSKVVNILEEGAEVLFVDYGNSAVATQFVKLSEALARKEPCAMHCALRKQDWPEEANGYFSELSGGGSVPFRMKVVEQSDPSIVSLAVDDKIVEQELDSLFGQANHEHSNTNQSTPEETETVLESSDNSDVIKTVFLIQVNSPSDFFLHTAEATQNIEKISEKLTAAEDFPLVEESSISKGNIVAAQFDEDDLWYRARILDHSDNETKVLFIDYGNTAKVAKMKDLPEDLISTPPLAMHCSLYMEGVDEWSPKACKTLIKMSNDEGVSFDLKIVSKGEPNVVILYINGESVGEQLILASGLGGDENHSPEHNQIDDASFLDEAEPKVSGEEESTIIQSDIADQTEESPTVDNLDSISETASTDVGNNIGETSASPLQTDESEKHSQESSENGLRDIEISHFNSPDDFYVQYTDDKEELMEISDRMFDEENFETSFEAKEIVAAKYSCDGVWYRAKILNSNSNENLVLLIDYGKTDQTQDLKKLPKDLAEKKPLAKHCCLKSPRGSWTQTTHEKLSALAKMNGLTFEMNILEEGNPCIVDLFVTGRSLTETFHAQELDEEQTEMKDMLMNSIENQIYETDTKFMQQITDDLVHNAVNHTCDSPDPHEQLDLCEDKSEVEENDEGTNQNGIDSINGTHNNDTVDLEKQKDIPKGFVEDRKILIHETVDTKEDLKTVRNGSPSTPRRSNIDEHIVPGCISSVKLDDASDKS